jgi:hypothetical protein
MIAAFEAAFVVVELSSPPEISQSLVPSIGEADTGGEHGSELGPLIQLSGGEGL